MNKFILFLKGMFMGAADIIPGVSGGSIALITGIYDELIDSIGSINLDVIKDILTGKFKEGFSKIRFDFLIPLVLGIGVSIFSMARLMNYLLEEQELYTWSVFFGLILASAIVLGGHFKLTTLRLLNIIVGAVLSFIVVGLVPVETPKGLWFMFLAGSIAICAMILPGISGAFLLLIMGKYHYITSLLKDPFNIESISVLIVVAFGCLFGIVGFSRVLKFVLHRWHSGTMAFLTGMMIGSLRKIWPYKEVAETKIIDGDVFVVSERYLTPWTMDGFLMSLVCMLVGFVLILLLDKLTSGNKNGENDRVDVME